MITQSTSIVVVLFLLVASNPVLAAGAEPQPKPEVKDTGNAASTAPGGVEVTSDSSKSKENEASPKKPEDANSKEPVSTFTFRPNFVIGKTIARSAEDFSREDDFFAFSIDANIVDCVNVSDPDCASTYSGAYRQFLQLDYRLTPVVEDGKLSEKRSGLFGVQWYMQTLPKRKKGEYERFGSTGLLTGTQTIPGKDKIAWFAAPMYRLNVLRSGGPYESPDVFAYLLIAKGYWNNFSGGGRFYLEGRYQLANSPLLLGFESNTGHGAGDFRLLVAIKVDVEKFLQAANLSPKVN